MYQKWRSFFPLLSCLSEHRQRLPVVHRPGVSAQPDPGPQEDALPPLLAQPGHPFALSTHPATDVSPQVRPRVAPSLLASFDRMDFFSVEVWWQKKTLKCLISLEHWGQLNICVTLGGTSLDAVNNYSMISTVQLFSIALMVKGEYVIMSAPRSRFVFVFVWGNDYCHLLHVSGALKDSNLRQTYQEVKTTRRCSCFTLMVIYSVNHHHQDFPSP